MTDRWASGAWLAAYMAAGRAVEPFAPMLLRRRLGRGKEHPERWHEKLGHTRAPRPPGRLVWMHAVGLGEVLALRGLVDEVRASAPGTRFLLTSTARSSAEALARNLPEDALHQFLPLDLPGPRRRFLDHWAPDLAVWAEQDLWPGLVAETARRGVPLALVNARMNAASHRKRSRARGLYAPAFRCFALVAAQDPATARHLEDLGASVPVAVTGSLKPAAPPLADDPEARAEVEARIGARPVWLAASTHAEDEAVAFAAHRLRRAADPTALLVVAPRYAARGPEVAEAARRAGFTPALRSSGTSPGADASVYVADTTGEMGLWYRIAPAALIGGSFGPVEGHNPWEAVRLGSAVLHGPRTANFTADYARLDVADAARAVAGPEDIAAVLSDPGLPAMARRASAEADAAARATRDLARDLVRLMDRRHG